MRILAVNQFYAPDRAATAQLLTQLCEDLAAMGDDVSVVASRGAYLGGGRLPARERIGGVEVVRPWSTRLGKSTHLHRMADYLSFWATSVAQVAIETEPDVIVALTTPPMIAAGAAAIARARKVPLVTWVQDVYPEVAVELGALPSAHPVVWGLKQLARTTHRMTTTSVVLSQCMKDRIVAQGQRPDRVEVIPNWSDGSVIAPMAHDDNPFRQSHATRETFLVMYSGNLGQGHDVATLVDAARLLAPTHDDISFLFVGDGVRRREAEERAAGLSNVRFLGYQPFDALAQSLSAADVHLVSLRDRLEGLIVPSKLYGVLAAGRAVMFVGPHSSEVARVVHEHDLGWVGSSGDAVGLARAVAAAHAARGATERRGRRAREVFESYYDRRTGVARWRETLSRACEGG